MIGRADAGALALAERILAMLDRGSFTATYKYAVLLGLLDLAMEQTSRSGVPPDSVTTAQLADRVIELYWPHAVPFEAAHGVLRQNQGGQAEIVALVQRFRERTGDRYAGLERARRDRPAFAALRDKVERVLIEMPLPKLQRVGTTNDPFLYSIAWDDQGRRPARGEVRKYQQGERSSFDNRLLLSPGVGDALVRLNGMLRPLIYREWAVRVAELNNLPSAELEQFLFGRDRAQLTAVSGDLLAAQESRCFYCGSRVRGAAQVDHFVPWSRYPNDRIENLVAADAGCNRRKSDHLAAAQHLRAWQARLETVDLSAIAALRAWPSSAEASRGVVGAIYRGLGDGVPLWREGDEFEPSRAAAIDAILLRYAAPHERGQGKH